MSDKLLKIVLQATSAIAVFLLIINWHSSLQLHRVLDLGAAWMLCLLFGLCQRGLQILELD